MVNQLIMSTLSLVIAQVLGAPQVIVSAVFAIVRAEIVPTGMCRRIAIRLRALKTIIRPIGAAGESDTVHACAREALILRSATGPVGAVAKLASMAGAANAIRTLVGSPIPQQVGTTGGIEAIQTYSGDALILGTTFRAIRGIKEFACVILSADPLRALFFLAFPAKIRATGSILAIFACPIDALVGNPANRSIWLLTVLRAIVMNTVARFRQIAVIKRRPARNGGFLVNRTGRR